MMILICRFVLAFFVIFLGHSLSAKELKLATHQFPPYIYKENGEIKGICKDLLNEISKRSSLTFKIEFFPWRRSIELVKKRQIDGIFPAVITKEREVFLNFSDSFLSESISFFTKKNSRINYNGDIRALRKYKIGRVRGYQVTSALEQEIKNGKIKIEETSSPKKLLLKLSQNRPEIIIENRLVILNLIKKNNLAGKIVELKPTSNVYTHIGLSKDYKKDTIDMLNKSINEIKKDGTYAKIMKKYSIYIDSSNLSRFF